jgi:hypothetical protein
MTDLRTRMRIYDQAPAPEYWDEVVRRASGASVGEGTPPTMNRFVGFGLAAAVVVLVAIVGAQLLGGTAPGGPSPSEAPSGEGSRSPAASAGPSAASEFFIDSRYLLFAEVRAPIRDGWAKINRFIYSTDERLGFGFWSTDGVWADPCSWRTTSPVPLGRPPISAEAFIEALVQQPGREPSDPTEVELGGWEATRSSSPSRPTSTSTSAIARRGVPRRACTRRGPTRPVGPMATATIYRGSPTLCTW